MGYIELAKELKITKIDNSTIPDDEMSPKTPYAADVDIKDSLLDQLARLLDFMVGISRKLYFATLSKNSAYKVTMIFIKKTETGWEAHRKTFTRGRRYAIGIRKIVRNKQIKTVIKTVRNYLHSIKLVYSA
jgi:hypothetical protein